MNQLALCLLILASSTVIIKHDVRNHSADDAYNFVNFWRLRLILLLLVQCSKFQGAGWRGKPWQAEFSLTSVLFLLKFPVAFQVELF